MTQQVFNINAIIEKYKLADQDLAEVLFPLLQYKVAALNRIKKGEATIDVDQLVALSKLCGVGIQDLVQIDGANVSLDADCIVFTIGKYTNRINYNGSLLSIYDGPKQIASMILNTNTLNINDVTNIIYKSIKNYENGTTQSFD